MTWEAKHQEQAVTDSLHLRTFIRQISGEFSTAPDIHTRTSGSKCQQSILVHPFMSFWTRCFDWQCLADPRTAPPKASKPLSFPVQSSQSKVCTPKLCLLDPLRATLHCLSYHLSRTRFLTIPNDSSSCSTLCLAPSAFWCILELSGRVLCCWCTSCFQKWVNTNTSSFLGWSFPRLLVYHPYRGNPGSIWKQFWRIL